MDTDNQTNQGSGEGGLLDSATIDDGQAAQLDTSSTEISHMDEPEDDGPLERPDWWPEKFWKKDSSEPALEEIAKSYAELEKQFRAGKHKPPADGNYDVSAFGDTPEDDPVRTHVLGWAKENGISQAALDKLVGEVVAMGGEQQVQVQRTIEQERKALGPNADAIISGMTDWARSLVNKGIWGKDDFEEFKVWGGTASGIKALAKLRETYEGNRIPLESVPVEGAPSKDELYAMVGDPKYKTDPAYRAKVEKLFAQNFS
jgi:hypothetical protein